MMATYVVAFLLSFVAGLGATWVVRDRARAWKLFDPGSGSRNVHRTPTPRLGGIAIVLAFLVSLAVLLRVDARVGGWLQGQRPFVLALLGGGLVIAALGLYDDLRGASPRLKLLVQLGVALLLYWLGVRVEAIANPFGPPLPLGVLALPFTVLWVVGIINALNLIDGLDGLAGGVSFFALLASFLLALAHGNLLLCLMIAALGGAVLAFLVFNSHPASIFMGDTGSMFLGLVLAAVSIKASAAGGTAVAILVPIIALGLPIMDTLLSMVRRVLVGRPMFSADREHVHHRLMSRLMMSHRDTVLFLYAVCAFFTLAAVGLHFVDDGRSALLLLLATAIVCIGLLHMLGYLSLREASAFGHLRRRNRRLRAVVRAVTQRIRAARSLPELSASMRPLVEALEAQRLILEVVCRPEDGRRLRRFKIERAGGHSPPLEARQLLSLGGVSLGSLVLVWRDNRRDVGRDEELAIERAAGVTAEAVSRLLAEGPQRAADVVGLGGPVVRDAKREGRFQEKRLGAAGVRPAGAARRASASPGSN